LLRSLEAFVRAKYEQKKYIAKEWVPPPTPKPATPNAIPAPKLKSSSSSASAAKSKQAAAESRPSKTTAVKSEAAVDLLGLDDLTSNSASNNDPFGSFLSAESAPAPAPAVNSVPAATTPVQNQAPNDSKPKDDNAEKQAEEENFFNQTEDPLKKQQLTKESILSLYGQSASPQPPPMFGVPGGMYVAPQSFPTQPMGMAFAAPTNVGMPPVANHHQQSMGMLPKGMMGNAVSPMQIQQQMAAMSVGGARQNLAQPSSISWANQPAGHTLSSNLWQ